ncbi:hypothetical protein CA13_72880 [Planctomycetes bacterium CA13]|uniref:Uncharacterized protein n=1 Tax=Novipirellula herctigrandis TaxID=2527986 RepID=A0A5C5YPN7_9BACT|nr:hypothetical protein CA13_72880 [Planctomycetes bacterium CA13]
MRSEYAVAASTVYLVNGDKADYVQEGADLKITLPAKPLTEYDTVVKVGFTKSNWGAINRFVLGSVDDSLLKIHENGCVEYEMENDWSVRSHALVERGGSGAA